MLVGGVGEEAEREMKASFDMQNLDGVDALLEEIREFVASVETVARRG